MSEQGDDLVQVASFLNVTDAEFARALLAMDGIRACLGNAAFLLWYWHFSNASGGVRVFVAERDAQRARAVLFSRGTPPQWRPSPWACPKCGTEADGMWQVCWACGTAKDGTEDPAFFEESERSRGLGLVPIERIAGLLTGSFLVLFLLTEGATAVFVAWLATMLCFGVRQTTAQTEIDELPAAAARDAESARDDPSHSAADAESEYDGMALRAWRTSVFALLSVPPLALYAIWLLSRIAIANAALRPANQWRVPAAWVFAIVALPLGAAWLAILALGPYGLLADIAQRLFNVSGITARPP